MRLCGNFTKRSFGSYGLAEEHEVPKNLYLWVSCIIINQEIVQSQILKRSLGVHNLLLESYFSGFQ